MVKQKETIATPDFGVVELFPSNGRKSFYGKCKVITQSGKHIKAFLDFIRMPISVKEFYNATRIER